jgi:hypothetical protein
VLIVLALLVGRRREARNEQGPDPSPVVEAHAH